MSEVYITLEIYISIGIQCVYMFFSFLNKRILLLQIEPCFKIDFFRVLYKTAGSLRLKTDSPAYDILENGWPYNDHDVEAVVDSIDGYRGLGRFSPAASIHDYDLSTTNAYYMENRQRMLNNETLYIVLGTVIGTMLIVFVMSLTACLWKQCQQRRILGRILYL